MKKLSFLYAMIFAVSMAMAQNTASVDQQGSNNDADVNQQGTEIYIDVVSNGNDNDVDVTQIGSELNATAPTVSGYVHQSGDDNKADLSQNGSMIDFKLDQEGGLNRAFVDQDGSWLQSEVNGLKQVRTGADGNFADITQKDLNGYQSLNILQRGSGNRIISDQSGYWNEYSAYQLGVNNKAEIAQAGNKNFEDWYTEADNNLRQNGNNNEAYISQLGDEGKFLVNQTGDENIADFEMTATGNDVDILQVGDLNTVGGMLNCQKTATAVFSVDYASLNATQRGDKNKLYVSTAGILTVTQNNTATPHYNREGNEIRYTQTETGDVELRQIGDANLIWLKNTSSTNPMDVDVDQVGDGNKVAQLRNNGSAKDCALFAGSHLDIDQLGNNNLLDLNSTGASDIVDVMQNGNGNWASVTQSAAIAQ